MKLGVLGGAFNPPHYGHLLLAQEAHDQFNLDHVVFVPSYNPPHKSVFVDYNHRLNMTRRALEDSRFRVSAIEWSDDISYTADMLRRLKTMHNDELFLIIGGDQAGSFFTWERPQEILELAIPVVSERSLFDHEKIYDHWGGQAHLLNFLDMPPLEISSSMIRQRIEDGRPLRYLVPDSVIQYLYKYNLYSRVASATHA